MVNIRFKKISSGYSAYLDVYRKGEKRRAIFLNLYLTKDYSGNFSGKGNKIKPTNQDNDKLALCREFLLSAQLQFARGLPIGEEKKPKPFSFLAHFQQVCEKKNHKTYSAAFKQYTQFLTTIQTQDPVPDNEIMQSFEAFLAAKGLSKNSISVYIMRVIIAINEAHRADKIPKNPLQYYTAPLQESNESEFLTPNEVQAMYDVIRASENATTLAAGYGYILACFTGLRISDIYSLRHDEIVNDSLRKRLKKGAKKHFMVLLPEAIQLLEEIKKTIPGSSELIIPLGTLNHEDINQEVRAIAKEAGINRYITFHSSRHTFVTMIASVADLNIAAKFAAHKSTKTTEMYAHLNDERMRKAALLAPRLQR